MNRGTEKNKKYNKTAISGEKFKENEDERLEKSGVKFISGGRGTKKIPVAKTKTLKKIKYRGKVVTGRGTGTKKE